MYRIAISGKMGSGKSTLATFLKTYFMDVAGRYGDTYSFADKLKEIATDVYKMENKDRQLLQTLGDNMRRVVGDDGQTRSNVWIDYLLKKMNDDADLRLVTGYRSDSILQIIDDLRYMNEYKILKENKFYLVRMECDTIVRQNRIGDLYGGENHLSECDLDFIEDWNFIIHNSTMNTPDLVPVAKHILSIVTDKKLQNVEVK